MQTRGRMVLLVALVLGVLGDYVLRASMWRLGFSLFIILAALGAAFVGGRGQRDRTILLGGLVLAAIGLALRDSPFLYAIDFLSILCTGALIVWLGSGKRIADLTVVQTGRAFVFGPLMLAFGAAGAIRDGGSNSTDEAAAAERGRRAKLLAIGAVLAIPPLLIVTGLLASSDQVFEQFVDYVGDFLANKAIQHFLVIGALTWAGAGWLRGATGGSKDIPVPEDANIGAPFLALSVALYGLTALLTLYMGVQLRALFGGTEYLMATTGLTVAEYARRGFFELVVASGIVLATLVAAEWALAPTDEDGRKRYRHVGTMLVVLVAMLMVSAATRMGLYVGSFGLTVDRVTATTVMVFVAAAVVTFALTTLRGRTASFGPAMLAVTIAWVIALNVLNLEAMIVRVNVARALAGEETETITGDSRSHDAVTTVARRFDEAYHAKLSADALPALLAAAPTLPAADCAVLATELERNWGRALYDDAGQPRRDWRGIDLAYRYARTWYAAGALTPCARTD